MQTLLQDTRIDPSDYDNEAIITASKANHPDVVKLLLQKKLLALR
jgi:hypothetical protein